jgi:hypothetical protein
MEHRKFLFSAIWDNKYKEKPIIYYLCSFSLSLSPLN